MPTKKPLAGFNVDASVMKRIDALRVTISSMSGIPQDRAKVLRMLVERSLPILEREFGIDKTV